MSSSTTPPEITTLPDRVLAAKTALWTTLVTANGLMAAGVVASTFGSPQPFDFWRGLAGFFSLIGLLPPVFCLFTVAQAESQAAGIKVGPKAEKLAVARIASWSGLEALSVICLILCLFFLAAQIG